MSSNIYHQEILDTKINIKSEDLNKDIDEMIIENLKKKIEGICIKEGYVRPGSIKMLSRSNGKMEIEKFDGDITYYIKYQADICNPANSMVIDCYVSDNNKSAVFCYYENEKTSPLKIFIPKQYHLGNAEFVKLSKGDYIEVEIVVSKFSYLDKEIYTLAKFLKKK